MIKRTKNFISFFVSAFIVLSISVSAFADPLTGALIGVLDGLGVVVGGVGLTPGIIDSQVGDPTRSDVPIALDGTTVTLTKRSHTIDGVDYDSILYSSEFAQFLNDEGLGWILDKSINPESSGTLASGVGFCEGVPLFRIGTNVVSQNYVFPYAEVSTLEDTYLTEVVGNFYVWTRTLKRTGTHYIRFSLSAGLPASWVNSSSSSYFYLKADSNLAYAYWCQSSGSRNDGPFTIVLQEFSFDYVSGTIDTGSKEGLNLEVLIPSGLLDDVPDGTYPVDSTGGNDTIVDINDAIVDTVVHGDQPIGNFVEPAPGPTPPPTPVPIPTDALGIIPTTTWMDIFGTAVKQGIQNINDTIGLFKQEVSDFFDTLGQGIQDAIEDVYDLVGLFKDQVLDTIDTWGQAIEDGLDDLGDIFNTGITSVRNILEAIRTAVASIISTLTDVLDHIKQGHLDLFQPVFDGIKIVFAPVLVLLKSALRLWHYVVEWVQAISPVFSTFFGFMSGTNYNMVLPIYAALAGPICFAIYKRFGR